MKTQQIQWCLAVALSLSAIAVWRWRTNDAPPQLAINPARRVPAALIFTNALDYVVIQRLNATQKVEQFNAKDYFERMNKLFPPFTNQLGSLTNRSPIRPNYFQPIDAPPRPKTNHWADAVFATGTKI